MGLNIKNPRAHALAAELAQRLGTSLTGAVMQALDEKLAATASDEAGRRERVRRILEIGRTCAARLSPEVRAIDHGQLLYDERGLPK